MTESQRARWQLLDLRTSGRARVVDEFEAFGLLRATPADPPPPTRWDNGPNGPASEARRALAAPDPRLDQALDALERVDLPGGVCETLRRELRRTLTTVPSEATALPCRNSAAHRYCSDSRSKVRKPRSGR